MSVVDLHSDMQLDLARPAQDPSQMFTDKHLPGMLSGEVSVRILATFSPPPDPTVAAFRHLAATRAAGCRVVTELEETRDDTPQFVLGLEGAEPFGQDLGLVEAFYWAGVRVVGLSWMHQNAVTGSCGEPNPGGITSFGREVLRELDSAGVIVDLAHISDKGFYDVIEQYQGPVMCSHTCARALREHSRNISDEEARLLAERDGLIGVCFFSDFLDEVPANRTVNRIVDHIEHFISVVGEDNVGIGPDWCDYAFDLIAPLNRQAAHAVDLASGFPVGLQTPDGLRQLREALVQRNLPADKVLFANGLRFLTGALSSS
jgi:membrane dipeptidase